jgi:hypothetical protein
MKNNVSNNVYLPHMLVRGRHSGMFLAGIQGIWQLDLANRMPGLSNTYPS